MNYHFFRYRPFIFKKSGPDHPMLQTLEHDAKKETAEAIQSMKGTPHKADTIAGEAKQKISRIVEAALDKMGLKTEEDLRKPENEPFMIRVAEIQHKTTETIDANLAKYEKHVEAAKLMVTLKTNYEALKKYENTRDLSAISTFTNAADALDEQRDLVKNYAPKEHRAVMLTDLEDQVNKFRAKAKEIAEYHVARIDQKDLLLVRVEEQAKNKDPKLSSLDIKELWDFSLRMRELNDELDEMPGMEELSQKVDTKLTSFWERVKALNDLHSSRSPDLVAANKKRTDLWKRLKKARAENEQVQDDPKSTDEEKDHARNALKTAEMDYSQHKEYFRRLNAAVDEIDLPWGADMPENIVAAAKQPERKIEGDDRVAVDDALEKLKVATTVKQIKRALTRFGMIAAQHGLDVPEIRRKLLNMGFTLPPLGADVDNYQLAYEDPVTKDLYVRSVKPLKTPIKLTEQIADVRKKGIPILNDLGKGRIGASRTMILDDIPVRITKHGNNEYTVGGKTITIQGGNENPLYKRIMAVALRRKRVRDTAWGPERGVRYTKAEDRTDRKAV